MGVYKAVKLKVMILTEPGLSDEEIIKWTNRALKDHAEFDEVVTTIVEKHESIISNLDDEAVA